MAGGWRLSAAVESAKKGPCLAKDCVRASCQHWFDLSSYLHSISSPEKELRVHALKSLGALLLCLASGSDPVSSAQGYVVSVPVGGTLIPVSDEDVVRLYKVLFLELVKLSKLLVYEEKCSGPELSDAESYVQTLCCCIRIIPVVDMFDTSLSHSGSIAVSDLFQQLCSFFPTGSLEERRQLLLRSSLLEVFLDEILLHRDSSYTLLTEGDEFVVQKGEAFPAGLKCRAAAFAHMIHHHCIKGEFSVQLKDVHGVLQFSKLSLPAGVLLLDISTVNRFPNRLVAHIISLVAAALRPTGSSTLPIELAIGLALSVVETAMGLLSKHYSSLECGGRGNDDIGEHLAALLRAMSCAVFRIGAEVCAVKSEDSWPGIGTRRAIEAVAAAISFNLPSMGFIRALGCFDQKMIDAFASEDAGGVIGWALIIFTHILFYESSQRGLEEALAAEFLGVLDSLTGLLLLENECRLANTGFSRTLLCGFWGSSGAGELQQFAGSDDINFYLEKMIKQLQRTAWDMCSRKKWTSNILSFISKVTPAPTSKAETLNRMTPDLTFQEEAEEEAEQQPQPLVVPGVRRASTLAIARRFKAKAQRLEPDSSCLTSLDCSGRRKPKESDSALEEDDGEEEDGEEEDAGENAFIAEMLKREKYEESFEDLKDFIVCKRGRSYSKFLNTRIKFRRKSHTRLIWKRREEKRSLLLALTNL